MKAFESICFFIYLVFFGACIDERIESPEEFTQGPKEYPNVHQALWTHFEVFEEEARERGYEVDLAQANIHGSIEVINDGDVAGVCSYGGGQRHRDVTIDKSFWNRASHNYREYIVFHELGHCFLFRDHYEACLTNRTYASLMRSGNGSCRDNYTASTRDYYINELFETIVGP